MSIECDYTFHAMGSDVRLLIGRRLMPSSPSPERIAEREHAYVADYARRLSRFSCDSELTALNRDPRHEVPASQLLRAAVHAALWAANWSDGLVDPTLVREIERSGYAQSRDGAEPASLADALAHAPIRRPARPHPARRWREIVVDDDAGVIIRPPGVMLDTGGTGKGLCADVVAHRLGAYARFLADCGGDIAAGGIAAQVEPFEIEVEHPLTGAHICAVRLTRGGIATSGLNIRIWRDRDGGFAHHLLDPSTGAPAWTGLIGVTALGSSALEAETLSKMALLLGPDGARELLLDHGGVLVHDDGEAEIVGLDGALVSSPPGRAGAVV